ncbi:protein YIPF2 [Rhodnius prolixus]|uniref:Protein YIPF n=1 Tax=Rhodnius prolixus TaxID=13249 RepID=R4FK76_RHOPR
MKNNQTEITFDAPPQFNFQNFADPPYSYSPTNDPLQYNNQQPNNQPAPERSNNSMFSLRFYQDLFDVNTDEVINRIKWSMVPNPRVNYLQNYIRNKPDLYGPFWICVTLVFTIAASGNLAEYLQTAAARNYHWKYDFHAITAAGTVIFCYAWLLPVILWAILHLYGNEQFKLNLLELLCVYGYTLSIFVPLSVLWVIPIHWIQWTLVAVGAVASGTVLITSVYSAFTPKLYPLLAAALILHILLATSFILYFFHAPASSPLIPVHPTSSVIIPNNDTGH